MSFPVQEVNKKTELAGESERNEHKKPTIVTVPPNASAKTSLISAAQGTGTTAVGSGVISGSKAAAKGADVVATAKANADKVKSTIATAQQAASDPISFALSAVQSATGFSIPSSPAGVAALLSKFSEKPDPRGDGTTDISKEKKQGSSILEKIGDIASLSPADALSKVTSAASQFVPEGVTEAVSSVTELASLGGVPVDNVISTSVNKVTQPVQSSLQKVKNVTDNTQGIIT